MPNKFTISIWDGNREITQSDKYYFELTYQERLNTLNLFLLSSL